MSILADEYQERLNETPDIIDDYFNLLKKIHKYFGYKEDWCIFPLKDCREYYWQLWTDEVIFHEDKEEVNEKGDYYSAEIYRQRFLKKWVYETEHYTMILVDTHVDGNKFLAIFDNDKKLESVTLS